MTPCYLFQRFHNHLIVIHCQIGLIINGRQLMLGRSHLIMLSLRRHSQLPKLLINLLHIRTNPFTDGAKIVILQLLPLRRHSAEQGTSRIDQILPLQILGPIHQKILLFRSYRRTYPLCRSISKQAENPQGLFVNSLHGTKKGGFLIQSLTLVGTESRGNAERHPNGILPQKCR